MSSEFDKRLHRGDIGKHSENKLFRTSDKRHASNLIHDYPIHLNQEIEPLNRPGITEEVRQQIAEQEEMAPFSGFSALISEEDAQLDKNSIDPNLGHPNIDTIDTDIAPADHKLRTLVYANSKLLPNTDAPTHEVEKGHSNKEIIDPSAKNIEIDQFLEIADPDSKLTCTHYQDLGQNDKLNCQQQEQ